MKSIIKASILFTAVNIYTNTYADVLITQNPLHRISYAQSGKNFIFTIEIFDGHIVDGNYPLMDFATIRVDKNKNNIVDKYVDTAYATANAKLCPVYLIDEKESTSLCGKLPTIASYKVEITTSPYSRDRHSIFSFTIPSSELSFDESSANLNFVLHSSRSGYAYYPSKSDRVFSSVINIPFQSLTGI